MLLLSSSLPTSYLNYNAYRPTVSLFYQVTEVLIKVLIHFTDFNCSIILWPAFPWTFSCSFCKSRYYYGCRTFQQSSFFFAINALRFAIILQIRLQFVDIEKQTWRTVQFSSFYQIFFSSAYCFKRKQTNEK